MRSLSEAAGLDPDLPAGLPAAVLEVSPGESLFDLVAAGDVGLSGAVGARRSEDPLAAFAPFLATKDAALCNLETILTASLPAGRPFTAAPPGAEVLRGAGFTHFHLANNHQLAEGPRILAESIAAVETAGGRVLGAGASAGAARRPVLVATPGLTVALLACGNLGARQGVYGAALWQLERSELFEAVSSIRERADALVVSLHAGYMFLDVPPPELRSLALELTGLGVDAVLCHHPHVLQGIERRDGSVVCYSLGNFLFDPGEGRLRHRQLEAEQRQGALFWLSFGSAGLTRLVVLPTRIRDDSRVEWALGDEGTRVLARIETATRALGEGYLETFHRQRGERNTAAQLRTLLGHLRHGELAEAVRLLSRLRPEHARMLWHWLRRRLPQRTPTP